MVRAVVESDFDINHWIAGDDTVIQRLFHAHLDGLDIFLWHHAADNGIDELEALAALIGRYPQPYVSILAVAARLPDELALCLRFTSDRFAVGNLGTPDVSIDFEFAEEAILDHFQVQLAHAPDDGLPTFRIGPYLEGRILLSELAQGNRHLVLVGACFRLDSNLDNRFREDDGLKHNRVLRIAERIPGEGIAQTDGCADVSRSNLVDILAMIGMQTQQATNTFRFPLCGVLHRRAFSQCARVDAQVREAAYEGIGDDFRDQGAKGSGIADLARHRLAGIGIDAGWRRNVQRRGQVSNDGIKHGLHALVSQGSATKHRHQCAGNRCFTQGCDKLLL